MARVLFACGASRDYIRNRTLVRALARKHEVKVVASAATTYPRRLGSVLPQILMASGRFDIYLAGFLGQPLMPFLRARSLGPIILDALVSVYDTLCLDRRTFRSRSPIGRLARWLDSRSFRWADCILTVTAPDADFMAQEFGVARSKFMPVPVGADESLFYPRTEPSSNRINVLYTLSYLPLQGAEVVVEAARLLKDRDGIRFTLIGSGPQRPRVAALAHEYGLSNCRFIDRVPMESVADHMAACHIFLGGHFNAESTKAKRVVAGKVYEGLATARPTIIGECEASQEWFRHGESAYMVRMGDADALADAILELAGSARLRRRVGEGGHALYQERFSEAAIAARLEECILAMLGRH
jgi:glycosyltransferase involved in cell wall biosynthesis